MWQPGKKLHEIEREVILQAYKFYEGNKTHTANSLGISTRCLFDKLVSYGKEKADGLQPEERLHVESDSSGEKRTMPVQERQEVQKMPRPRHAKSG